MDRKSRLPSKLSDLLILDGKPWGEPVDVLKDKRSRTYTGTPTSVANPAAPAHPLGFFFMFTPRIAALRLTLAVLIAIAAIVVDDAAAAAAARKAVTTASIQKITPTGVGQIKLGETYAKLRAHHLVGTIKQGCELAGPNARSASLSAPLKGNVDFTMNDPRTVVDISVRGGAVARSVSIGATIARIKAAYPKAKIDHSTDHTFGVTLVRIPKNGGGKLEFAVDTETHKVVLIGIPFIAFCE